MKVALWMLLVFGLAIHEAAARNSVPIYSELSVERKTRFDAIVTYTEDQGLLGEIDGYVITIVKVSEASSVDANLQECMQLRPEAASSNDTAANDTSSAAEPGAEPGAEPEGTAEPGAEPGAEPEATAEPGAEPEATAGAEPEAEATAEPAAAKKAAQRLKRSAGATTAEPEPEPVAEGGNATDASAAGNATDSASGNATDASGDTGAGAGAAGDSGPQCKLRAFGVAREEKPVTFSNLEPNTTYRVVMMAYKGDDTSKTVMVEFTTDIPPQEVKVKVQVTLKFPVTFTMEEEWSDDLNDTESALFKQRARESIAMCENGLRGKMPDFDRCELIEFEKGSTKANMEAVVQKTDIIVIDMSGANAGKTDAELAAAAQQEAESKMTAENQKSLADQIATTLTDAGYTVTVQDAASLGTADACDGVSCPAGECVFGECRCKVDKSRTYPYCKDVIVIVQAPPENPIPAPDPQVSAPIVRVNAGNRIQVEFHDVFHGEVDSYSIAVTTDKNDPDLDKQKLSTWKAFYDDHTRRSWQPIAPCKDFFDDPSICTSAGAKQFVFKKWGKRETKQAQSVLFYIGAQDCSGSSNTDFCNGPIPAGKYYVTLRGIKGNFFRNGHFSAPVEVSGKKPDAENPAVVVPGGGGFGGIGSGIGGVGGGLGGVNLFPASGGGDSGSSHRDKVDVPMAILGALAIIFFVLFIIMVVYLLLRKHRDSPASPAPGTPPAQDEEAPAEEADATEMENLATEEEEGAKEGAKAGGKK